MGKKPMPVNQLPKDEVSKASKAGKVGKYILPLLEPN